MYTCIPSHGLKRSWRSCPARVNAGNKNTPSTHHPQRRKVTTSVVGLKNNHIRKNLAQKGDPQRYSWEHRRRNRRFLIAWDPRDIAANTEEDIEAFSLPGFCPSLLNSPVVQNPPRERFFFFFFWEGGGGGWLVGWLLKVPATF